MLTYFFQLLGGLRPQPLRYCWFLATMSRVSATMSPVSATMSRLLATMSPLLATMSRFLATLSLVWTGLKDMSYAHSQECTQISEPRDPLTVQKIKLLSLRLNLL